MFEVRLIKTFEKMIGREDFGFTLVLYKCYKPE